MKSCTARSGTQVSIVDTVRVVGLRQLVLCTMAGVNLGGCGVTDETIDRGGYRCQFEAAPLRTIPRLPESFLQRAAEFYVGSYVRTSQRTTAQADAGCSATCSGAGPRITSRFRFPLPLSPRRLRRR